MSNTRGNYISCLFKQSISLTKKGTFLLKNTFISFIFSIGIISSIQWMSFHFLFIYCHNSGLKGFILNPINLGNPLCLAVNNIQIALVNHYISIWAGGTIIFISWIISAARPHTIPYQEPTKDKGTMDNCLNSSVRRLTRGK